MEKLADGRAVGAWHPDAGVQFAGRNSRKRWWLTSPVHQGDHGGAVKTIAQGMPCDFGGPCECACVFSFIAREAAGASSIRHSLRPRFFEGARISSKTRALGAVRSRRLAQSSSP